MQRKLTTIAGVLLAGAGIVLAARPAQQLYSDYFSNPVLPQVESPDSSGENVHAIIEFVKRQRAGNDERA